MIWIRFLKIVSPSRKLKHRKYTNAQTVFVKKKAAQPVS